MVSDARVTHHPEDLELQGSFHNNKCRQCMGQTFIYRDHRSQPTPLPTTVISLLDHKEWPAQVTVPPHTEGGNISAQELPHL